MSGFREPRPELVAPNPGGVDDPLGESVADPALDWLRVFEPASTRLVIGRHQDPERELDCPRARADGIPIHRRIAGGGAVVLAPGMLVVAVRLLRDHLGTTSYITRVNQALIPAIAARTGLTPCERGLGDLAIAARPDGAAESEAPMLKILGASLRQSGGMVIYLGCLLVADRRSLMARYLKSPSREPNYRRQRPHEDFCTDLGSQAADLPGLAQAITASCRQRLLSYALPARQSTS